MHRVIAILAGVTITILGSTSFAETPPINDNLKGLKPLIGKWATEITLEEDSPILGKQGDKVSFVGIYKWTPNRNAVTLTVTANVGDEVINVTNGLLVWDALNKKIVGLDAYVQGGMYLYEVQMRAGEILLVGHGATRDGATMKQTVRYSDISRERITGQFVQREEGGQSLPDGEPYTLTRVKKKS
jgi:hypothetical protein